LNIINTLRVSVVDKMAAVTVSRVLRILSATIFIGELLYESKQIKIVYSVWQQCMLLDSRDYKKNTDANGH